MRRIPHTIALTTLVATVGFALAEEAIIPSGFTEADYLYSCPADTGNSTCGIGYSPFVDGDEGKLRFLCQASHLSYDDPIVFPGVADATHLHQFLGNPHTNKDSTFATLRVNTDVGTCAGGPLNNTGYWYPAMIRPQSNQVVVPDYIEFYYTITRDQLADQTSLACPNPIFACPMTKVQRIERGMKMISGFRPSTGTFPLGNRNFNWQCDDGSSLGKAVFWDPSTPSNGVQACPAGQNLTVRLGTSGCWNGSYDSADHYTHMADPIQDGFGLPTCPATHTKRIVGLSVIIAWSHNGENDYKQWYLSSDRFNGATYRSGESFHTDFLWAWSQNIMDAFNAELNGMCPVGSTCPPTAYGSGIHVRTSTNGGLGNGTAMKEGVLGIVPTPKPEPDRYRAIPSRAHGYHRVRVNVTP